MRIVIDLQACQASNGRQGIGRSSLEFTRALARVVGQDHELLVALNAAFPAEAERVKRELRGLVRDENFVAWQTPVPCDGRTGGDAEKLARALRRQFFESLGADVVHTPSVIEGFNDNAITAIDEPAERRYVESATLHDLIPLVHPHVYLGDPQMDAWYRRKLGDLNRADLLLAVSAFSREEGIALLGRSPDSVVNMSSGVGSEFQPRPDSGEVRRRHGIAGGMVMYGGGIDVRKNVERLIQAYGRLPEKLRSERQLAIVCRITDHQREIFSKLAQDAGLRHDELVMTGYVTDSDLVALYSTCDLFVFPSWHEGFGLPALEAMACGAPVIASGVSSLPEVVGREDALFDPLDVDSIRNVMARALSDRAWAGELAIHGRQRASGFTWEATACTALAAFEQAVAKRPRGTKGDARRRPTMAYVSPVPPERSGISDYSSELLPALARHYEITVVTPEARKSARLPNIEVRDTTWFAKNAATFDRIVYQFGNSTFHTHMFEQIASHPGVAVLHDFFLSGIVAHLSYAGYSPAMWDEYLYRSHGYSALQFKARQTDNSAAIWKFPANLPVVNSALGVVVHSRYAVGLAEQWYGCDVAKAFTVVPQLRARIDRAGQRVRREARRRIGIPENVFLVCSFGMVGPSKLSARLLDAWELGGFSADPGARLVFVGANQDSLYGHELQSRLSAGSGNAVIGGFVDDSQYLDYLLAADVAVQLRTLSRGETSRAALDCMAAGLPLVVNRNGSMAEIPAGCALQIEDDFDDGALVMALGSLRDPEVRSLMSKTQRDHVEGELSPDLVAAKYREAIEAAYDRPLQRSLKALGGTLQELGHDDSSLRLGWEAAAYNCPGPAPRQLLVDVSELVNRDARSGIQRVVRGVLEALFNDGSYEPCSGYRVEPVYTPGDGRYYYARAFSGMLLKVSMACPDEPVQIGRGDIFLGLDLAPVDAVAAERALTDMRMAGARVFFVVYDVLPMQRPDCFPPEAGAIFRPWTEMVARLADGVVCISRQVCNDFAEAADALGVQRSTPLPLWRFPLGMSLPNAPVIPGDMRPDFRAVVEADEPLVLMVGTLEPRKGHQQAIDALEILWADGYNPSLVIVGKQGWMVESLISRINGHAERGRRLHWMSGLNDEELDALYARADVVLCASEAEGYGLPLIEAISRKAPLIARDIPVFREVAGSGATFFSGTSGADLAPVLVASLVAGKAHGGGGDTLECPSWQDSVGRLVQIVCGHAQPDMEWVAGRRLVLWWHQDRLSAEEQVVSHGRLARTSAGELVVEAAIDLAPGRYRLIAVDPLGCPGRAWAPSLSTASGEEIRVAAQRVTAHESQCDFDVRTSIAGLRLTFPATEAAAVGSVALERLG